MTIDQTMEYIEKAIKGEAARMAPRISTDKSGGISVALCACGIAHLGGACPNCGTETASRRYLPADNADYDTVLTCLDAVDAMARMLDDIKRMLSGMI